MLEGGELVHTYRTLSEEIVVYLIEAQRFEDGGRREDGFGWNITQG